MERLTPLAASFLEAEDVDPGASLAIGSLALFEGPAPDFDDFVESIRGRLPLIPRYRQKLRRTPLDLTAPVWADDPHFDLAWHLRRTAVPQPGGQEQIAHLMSRVMTRRMDRSRPLWEYWFVEGLEDGQWGLLSKLHHSMVDGVSGTDLYQLVLDQSRTPTPAVTDDWLPAQRDSTLVRGSNALRELITVPARAATAVAGVAGSPAAFVRGAVGSARGVLALAGAGRPVDHSSLTGPLDGSRRYAWTTCRLSEIAVVRKAQGVTVNDVALAAVSGGLRQLLESRGEEPTAHTVRTLVPVSTRAPGEESILDNRVSLMLPYLPVDVADPLERLTAVHDRIRAARGAHEPEAGGLLTRLSELGPFAPVAWGVRLGLSLPQHQITTVTTNVPGPRETLYALGREMTAVLPYVPIADRVRIGVAMFSYRDDLVFGLTGDYQGVSDLAVLADGISAAVDELIALSPA